MNSRHFGFSTRSRGHMIFSLAGTAHEAGAGGRSGAAGIPVHGSLNLMGRFSLCFLSSSREGKHHVTKTSR